MERGTARTIRSSGRKNHEDLLRRVKEALTTAREVSIPVDNIRPFPDQPRKHFDREAIRRLSSSIRAGGQTTPGLVRRSPNTETEFELIDGERRLQAIQMIPENERPPYRAQVIVADDRVVRYLISGVANFNRASHTPLEIMHTISEYVKFGIPMEEIATLLGMSVHWAYQTYGLRNLDPKVSALLDPTLPKEKRIGLVAAMEISKMELPLQYPFAMRVLRKEIGVGSIRAEVVRTARNAGTSIRLRIRSPLEQWGAFQTKARATRRALGELEEVLAGGMIDRLIQNNPQDSEKMLKEIDGIISTSTKLRERFQGVRKK